MKNGFQEDLKILVIGTNYTGKTSFINKFTKNIFNDVYRASIISEIVYKTYEKDGNNYKIQFWDMPYKITMESKRFIYDVHGCIILSDAKYKETRNDALNWKKSLDEVVTFFDGGKLPCILVESKSDLVENKENNKREIKDFVEYNEFDGGFLVSSKLGENINESAEYLIDKIIERMELIKDKDVIINRKSFPLDPEKYYVTKPKQEKKKKKLIWI